MLNKIKEKKTNKIPKIIHKEVVCSFIHCMYNILLRTQKETYHIKKNHIKPNETLQIHKMFFK